MEALQNRPWKKYYQDEISLLEFEEVSLYSILVDSAKAYGKNIAITFNDQQITYNELKCQTDQLASSWKNMNFEKGERIGLMADNHPNYIIAYYAAQALGLIVVKINPTSTPVELLQILADAKASYIITDDRSLKTVSEIDEFYQFKQVMAIKGSKTEINDPVLYVEDLKKNEKVLEFLVPIDAKEDIAVIQYSGLPYAGRKPGKLKGAMLTHHNLTANLKQSFAAYRAGIVLGKEIVLAAFPLHHVYAMTSAMNLGIYMGANILLIEKYTTDKMMSLIKKHRPTFFPSVPKMYRSIIDYPKVEEYGLNCFGTCISGSAPLPFEVMSEFERLSGTKIIVGFGLPETSPTTHRTPNNGERKIGSIGIPIPGTDSCISGHDPAEFKANVIGELLIRGPQVMKGYWNNEAATKQILQGGWFHTGYLAKVDKDGYFFIVGQKNDVINFGGISIYPEEIEEALYEYHDIKEAKVIGLPDETYGEIVKAFVVPKDGREIDIDELRDYCYAKLSPFKVPKKIEVIENLPGNRTEESLGELLVTEENAPLEQSKALL